MLPKPEKIVVKEPINKTKDLKEPITPSEKTSSAPKGYSTWLTIFGVFIIFFTFLLFSGDDEGAMIGILGVLSWGLLFFLVYMAYSRKQKECKQYEIDYKEKLYPAYLEECEKLNEKYNQEVEEYSEKVKEAETNYTNELDLVERKEELIKNEIGRIDASIAETEKVLASLYEKDIVFPKYRNMVAMCTIYEYFASGRVTTLEGPDGAYNLYEQELRQNLVINNLSQIANSLEQIKNNQYIVYTEITKTNAILNNVSNDIQAIKSSTNSIAASSAITAMCTESIAKNTETLAYLGMTGQL